MDSVHAGVEESKSNFCRESAYGRGLNHIKIRPESRSKRVRDLFGI